MSRERGKEMALFNYAQKFKSKIFVVGQASCGLFNATARIVDIRYISIEQKRVRSN